MTRKFALLIGNSDFRHETLARLSAPSSDVRAFADVLGDPQVAGFDDVALKLDSALVDVRDAIGRLYRNKREDDLVLLYYSGHGLTDVAGNYYLALTETDPDNPDPGSVDRTWLLDKMNNCASRKQVAIFDCCHAGGMIPEGMLRRDAATSPIIDETTFEPKGHGRYILAATTARGSAFEQDGKSLYTSYLVDGLKSGGAAPESDVITIRDLHEFVQRRAAESVADAMRPQLWRDAAVNPEPLEIARNPNPRRPLDKELVALLFSDDPFKIGYATLELGQILRDPEDQRGEDAERVLRERLEQSNNLTHAAGKRIETVLEAQRLVEESEVKKAEQRARKSEDTIAELRERLASAVAMAEAQRNMAKSAEAKSETRIAELERQIDDLSGALDSERREASSNLDGERKRADASEADVKALSSELDGLREEYETLKAMPPAGGRPSARQVPVALLLSVAIGAGTGWGVHELSSENLSVALGDARGEVAELDGRVAGLTKQLAEAQGANERMQREFEARLESAQRDLRTAKNALEAKVEEASELRRRLDAAQDASKLWRPDAAGIRGAQETLKRLGLYDGEIDGLAGPAFMAAIGEFRSSHGLPPERELTVGTREALSVAERYAEGEPNHEPFATLKECDACPEMIVLPGGAFSMGSPEDEEGRDSDEGPRREVTIAPFALARTEVTFDQWDACVADDACNEVKDEWGRGGQPVIRVSWQDAQDYVSWLSRTTGAEYRLPTEAEWEYAARAGTDSPFAFGETISTSQANYDGNYSYGSGEKGSYRQRTVEVGELDAANEWGLRHMHGNVWEWVEDCYADTYEGAPDDGSAWRASQQGNCARRVVRGGSWSNDPRNLRSANRNGGEPGSRGFSVGFRPARTLTP